VSSILRPWTPEEIARVDDLVRPDEGLVSRQIYIDPDIYQLELERIFARSWLSCARKSQLPNKGDFVTTTMGEDPILVTRDRDGVVRAFLNTCRHKGMRVCRLDEGNAGTFQCPYHAWTYRNTGELLNVPNADDAYFGDLDRSRFGLTPIAQIDSYRGLVFGNLDPNAPGLADYLGEMGWYLDILFDRTEGGSELVGSVQKWRIDCNWKFPAENFTSDFQHAQTMTHTAALKVQGMFNLMKATDGVQMSTTNGHGLFSIRRDWSERGPGRSMPDYVLDWFMSSGAQAVERLGPLRGSGAVDVVAGTVFPNFSFLMPALFPSVRVWQPRGPEQIEIWSWCVVPADAPQDVKDWIRVQYQRNFGPGGMFEQDDAENWQHATASNRGAVTRQGWLSVHMGLGHEPNAAPDMPGFEGRLISESNQRRFHRQWKRMIQAPEWSDLTKTNGSGVGR
jgi:3-phenylpropionate/trans-cinnamate dioxygenase subunit alpha